MTKNKTFRKKIGGLRTLLDSEFKYTLDKGRIDFAKAIYPHLDTVIENINAIEWNSYNYTGPDILTKVFTNLHEDEDQGYNPDGDVKPDVIFLKTVPVYISKTDPIHIMYMGGIVYELLNKTYQTSVDMIQYCDPTSDIDINLINIPRQMIEEYKDDKIKVMVNEDLPTEGNIITINNTEVPYKDLISKSDETLEDNDYAFHSDSDFTFIRNFYDLEGKITPYYQHLTQWIFNQLTNCFENDNLNELMNSNLFEDLNENNLIDYEEFYGLINDVDQGYLIKKIGKCFLVGFLSRIGNIRQGFEPSPQDDISSINDNSRMYKVQLIAKTSGENSNFDHLMELIVNFKYDSLDIATEKKPLGVFKPSSSIQKYNSLDNIFHQNMAKLMLDNISAFKEREVFITESSPQYVHKAINHVKRMLYLLELINKNKNDFFEITENKYFFGIAGVSMTTKSGPSSLNSFFNLIYKMIKDNKRFPIKANTTSDGLIRSFEYINPMDILLSYIMLYLLGMGHLTIVNNLNKLTNGLKLSSETLKENIPNEFADLPNNEKEKMKEKTNIFLNSDYKENNKYTELMTKLNVIHGGGKKNKRRTKNKKTTLKKRKKSKK